MKRMELPALLLGIIAGVYFSPHPTADDARQPVSGAASAAPVAIVDAQVPEYKATAAAGKKGYRRSCVHCHGIDPIGLRHSDAARFARSVLSGAGQMPALAYKLDRAEVDAIRRYVAACNVNIDRC